MDPFLLLHNEGHGTSIKQVHAVCWSFVEFGEERLSTEHVWLVGGIIKSNSVQKTDGGLGCVWKHLLRLFFGDDWCDAAIAVRQIC